MRRYVFRLTFLALAALGTSVVLGNDQQIAQTIVQKLSAEKKSGNLKGFNIELNVEEGTVWLSGRVSTEGQRTKALDIARRVPGVKQVVNDLAIEQPVRKPTTTSSIASNLSAAVRQAVGRGEGTPAQPAAAQEVGTGVAPMSPPAPAQLQAVPVAPAPVPVPAQAFPAQAFPAQAFPAQAYPAQPHPAQAYPAPYYQAAMPAQPIPYVYARSTNQVPLAYAPARTIAYNNGGPGDAGYGPAPVDVGGGPMPIQLPGTSVGMAAARYDHPQMPGYAWPSYASHPNYAAVTYPKQYSPTAWPYIGPFYPYPQVPMGWRKVKLEWDDGWWFLDFTAHRH